MKLLHISSDHSKLEHDLLTIFSELGIEWFSTGHYLYPQNPYKDSNVDNEPLSYIQNKDLISEFKKICPNKQIHGPTIITKEFADKFDIILVSHCCPWPFGILANWQNIKHKSVIWHTYSQQQPEIELKMQPLIKEGLKVIRVSPNEQKIKHALPNNAVIRGYVDESIYSNWTGQDLHVLTFNNFFSRREIISNTKEYLHIVKDIPYRVYGGYADNNPNILGFLDNKQQIKAYQGCRVYMSLGSKPAAVTYNFAEAMTTGCPTITWGPGLGNHWGTGWAGSYEQCNLVTHGVDGFASDNLAELNSIIKELLNNYTLAKNISENARQTGIKHFSKEKIKNQWKEFLNSI